MTEPKENLKKKIDINQNQRIDNNEVDNFLKNNNPEELNELGEHLNNLPIYNNDQIKNALNNFFRSTERNKYEQSIKNKVTNNQPLDKTELSLMYLAMVSQPNKHLNQQQLIFDTTKPIDQICNGELIFFIRGKYNSPGYLLKRVEIDLPNQKQKNKITPSINPLEKVSEAKKIGGTVELPTNIPEIKENNADFYCERLTTRAENNFPNEISKAKREIESKHRYKNDNEKLAYIKYDTLLIAFEKYTEIVGKKHNAILHQAGYKDEELESQGKLLETFQEEMQQKYPNMDTILSKLKEYEKEIENNEKKYFNDKNKLKAAEENNKEFNEYIEKKTKEFNIKEIETTIIKDPETPEEAEQYLKNLNKIYVFQEEITEKNKSYGDNITKYQKYIKGATIIQNKYNIQQYSDILNKYNQDISNWGKKINFKKYENYVSLIQGDRKLNTGLKNIKTLEKLIKDQNKKLLVKEFKQVERRQQIKQEESDNFRNNLKNFNGLAYRHLNILSSLRNGLVESTIGAGTGLGVMILGLIGGKDETLAQMDRKEKRDDFLKIGQSSSQKEDVYNFDTGEFNFHADNTVSTVASSISQMLVLIHGGGGLAKGATKAFGIGEKVAGRVGLFSSSFIMQVGGSYQEAITNGLKGGEALGYGMLSATIQSGLELVSPNEVLLGKGSGITKELIKNACKSGSKESLKMIGKTFAKNVGLEIVEENIQEALQLASGNLINMAANGAFGSELRADWSWKNFASTAIITTLTTGITTGTSTGLQMNNLSSQDKTKLIEHIKSDKGTYTEVTEMIDKAIAGKTKIPNVDVNQLQELKGLLNSKESMGNTDYFSGKSKKLFEGDETQTHGNSEMMDNLLNEIKREGITKTKITEKFEELRKKISEEYKQSTGEDLNLTNEQLLSILDAHEQDGKLGELTLGQLRQKVKILDETITDSKVRRFLLEAGFCGRETSGAKVEDSVDPNIKTRLRENLGIEVDEDNIKRLSKLTEEQIINVEKNKKRFENLGIKIDKYNIGSLSELTEEQIINVEKNQKHFEKLGIKIDKYNIESLSKLTEEQIINVEKNKKRLENLGIEVDGYNIGRLSELTKEQIINVETNQKRFENLGIKIDKYNIAKLSELTEEEIINLETNRGRLKNLFGDKINILIWEMSELTEKEIGIFEKLKSIGIKIDSYNIGSLSELTEEQIINVETNQKRFENLGIKIDEYNIGSLSELTEEQIINVETNQKRFENLGIKIDEYNIKRLSKLTEEQIINVEKNKKCLENLGIEVDGYNIGRLSELTEEEIINLETNQKRFENLGIKIDSYNIEGLSELTEEEIINLETNQKRFENLGIKINKFNIGRLNELTEEQIINVEKNQKRFENLGIEVDGYNINILSKLNNEQIMKIEKGEILKDIQTIKLSECDVNKKYFHFTNKKNIGGILNFGLQPKIGPASKLVNDVPNISISQGERGMFGIIDSFIIEFSEMQINEIPEEFKTYFTDIDNFSSKKILSKASVYNAICNKLKEDVYIYIDTNPKDQIFQDAKFNSGLSGFCLFDIGVHCSIEPSKLRVIADENGHILSSYDVISHLFEKAQNDCCIRLNFPNLFKMMKFAGKNYSKQQTGNNPDYFNGKSHQFEVTETQARGNSQMMDNLLNQINEQNQSKKLEELRKNISEQYEQATGEKLNLMDEQLLSILDAHEQDGKLGELTLGQLRQKVKVLDDTITDSKVRRFLLEAGFCGKEYIEKYKVFNEYEKDINITKINSLEKDVLFDSDNYSDWSFYNEQPKSFLSVPTASILGSCSIWGGTRIKNNGEVVGGSRGETWIQGTKNYLMTTEGRNKLFINCDRPIQLSKIKGFNGEDVFYITDDGNHRVVAAKQIGLSNVLAEVQDNSIDNGVEKIMATSDKKLVADWIVRISKGYIDGEVQIDSSGRYELHFNSGAFDGCHLPYNKLSRYAYKYEKICGPINDEVENILDDMEKDYRKLNYYDFDGKMPNKVIENYFTGKLDEIKSEFENKSDDSWMNEYLIN